MHDSLEFELVLPCYNESRSLRAVVTQAAHAATEAGYTPDRFQLVLVDNGSLDDSGQVMDDLKKGPLGIWFRKVEVRPNQGYGFGIWAGLRTVSAPYVGWSHADGQCDPAYAFDGLEKLLSESKSDPGKILVKGVRIGRNWKDVLVSRAFELFARAMLERGLYEVNAQPKIFPKTLLDHIPDPPDTFAFDLYVLYRAAKSGYRFDTVPVLFPPRGHGLSNWASTFASRCKTILGMIRYMWLLSRNERRP